MILRTFSVKFKAYTLKSIIVQTISIKEKIQWQLKNYSIL